MSETLRRIRPLQEPHIYIKGAGQQGRRQMLFHSTFYGKRYIIIAATTSKSEG